MNASVKIQGELVELRSAGAAVPNEVIGKAMEAPCKVLVDLAKAYCPVKTGRLRNAIGFKVSLNHLSKNVVIGIVGVRRKQPGRPTKYAHLVEFGHATSAEFRKESKSKEKFVPAKPFIRPAYEGFKNTAAQILGAEVANLFSVNMHAKMGGKKVSVAI